MTSPVATSRWVQWVFGTVFVLMTLNLIAAVARFQVGGCFGISGCIASRYSKTTGRGSICSGSNLARTDKASRLF